MSKKGWPHVDDPSAVGSRLKEARIAAGLSQRELSFPGCTAVYICRIERGDRVPSLQVLRELARRVGVEESYLATGSSQATESDQLLEADVALRLDQFDVAEHLYTQALERSASPGARARALAGLGQVDLHSDRVPEGIERLEAARDLLGDKIAEQPALVDALARAYAQRGDYETAIGLLEHTLELVREHEDERTETRLTVLLANVLIDGDNLPHARELLGSSIAKAESPTDPILQARLYWSRSRLHSAGGNNEAAARYARAALASIELTENVEYAAMAHHLLAYIELERGNAAEALDLLERGHKLAVRMGGTPVADRFRVDKARALAALGRDEEAVALATETAAALTEDRPEQAGRAYAIAADVHARQGDAPLALELYERAVELAGKQPEFLREVYGKMAELLEQDGRTDEALELLKRAVAAQSEPPEHRA
jgi:tetratricopeptide (TPR) repeat protein